MYFTKYKLFIFQGFLCITNKLTIIFIQKLNKHELYVTQDIKCLYRKNETGHHGSSIMYNL